MSGNIALPGIGSVVATDAVGAAQMQIIKLDQGGVGLSSLVTSTNPLAVVAALPTGASTSALQTSNGVVLTAISNATSTIITNQGTQETELIAINSSIGALSSALPLPTGAATSALQTAQETTLSSILTAVSATPLPTGAATAALQTSQETTLSSILAALAAPLQLPANAATQSTLAAVLSQLQVGAIASEVHLGSISETLLTTSTSLIREVNTTAYVALNTVGSSVSMPTNLTFVAATRNIGGSGYITKARIITNQSACVARFRLHLFNSVPTAIADLAPYTRLYANASRSIGSIDFTATTTEGTGSDAAHSDVSNIKLPFICASATKDIYGVLETLDGFTPIASQNFFIELTVQAN